MSALADTAAHEARHAAAALLLGIPIRRATAIPDYGRRGHTVVDLSDLDPELARKAAVLIIVGQIESEGWPPHWPLRKNAATTDEKQLVVLSDYLDLGEPGWSGLVSEALDLSARPEFTRLEAGLASLLERGHVLDEQTLRRVYAISEGGTMEHKTLSAETTVIDIVCGSGAKAVNGSSVEVKYVGVNYADGTEFDSSWKTSNNYTLPFDIGSGVIAGFSKGTTGMKVGGRREVIIPPKDGYGDGGPVPGGTLVFLIDLVKVS